MSVSSGSVLRKSACRAIQEVGGADIQSKMSEIVAKYRAVVVVYFMIRR